MQAIANHEPKASPAATPGRTLLKDDVLSTVIPLSKQATQWVHERVHEVKAEGLHVDLEEKSHEKFSSSYYSKADVAKFTRLFEMLDVDRSNGLDMTEMRHMTKLIGERFNSAELNNEYDKMVARQYRQLKQTIAG